MLMDINKQLTAFLAVTLEYISFNVHVFFSEMLEEMSTVGHIDSSKFHFLCLIRNEINIVNICIVRIIVEFIIDDWILSAQLHNVLSVILLETLQCHFP